MGDRSPAVTVVIATRNREQRLAALLDSLRSQRDAPPFEVVVVDDAGTDGTPQMLAAAAKRGDLDLSCIRHSERCGPAAARNTGWRAGSAPLVAFTDDDCVSDPGWLAALARAADGRPDLFVQGRTEPNPTELDKQGPFSRTLRIERLGPFFQTCNVAYPRALLERLGGFDEVFGREPDGEDADLAWRALGAGAEAAFAPDARVFHAVARLGPLGLLRVAARWTDTMLVFDRHPQLRAAVFTHRLFWKPEHYLLCRALVAAALPRRLGFVRRWLAWPYAAALLWRSLQPHSGGPLLIPYLVLHDLVELSMCARASARHRIAVL